jgi:tetratricopeptide (TPR) repeat protein
MFFGFAFVVLTMTSAAAPVFAQLPSATAPVDSNLEKNKTMCGNSDPDIAIMGCTALIDSRELALPDLANAFNKRGIAFIHGRHYDLAIHDFNEAIRIRPGDADAFFFCGVAYSNEGDFDRGMTDLNKSLEIAPKNANALYARGVTKQNMHDAAGAESDKTAAQEIDPDVAGKVVNSLLLARDITSPESTSAGDSSSVPDCLVIPGGLASSASHARFARGAASHTYVDDSVEQLKKAVPALHGVKFDEGLNATDSAAAAPARNRTNYILDKTSSVTAEMFHRIPNLVAKEVVQQTVVAPGQRLVSVQGGRPQFAGESLTGPQYHNKVYNYRIVPKGDAGIDEALDEFRTDSQNHPITDPDKDPDSPRSTGFATSWLYFVPGNLKESRFRYIGEQKIGNHETYVVAFAQIPGRTHMDTVVHTPTGGCSTYGQGLAWIDESTFRIVRMQTDLLYPIASPQLDQVRSVLNYGEVKIKKLNLTLWLPSDVETSWVSGQRAEDELHQYSDYRLFVSTVTILPPDQTSSQ